MGKFITALLTISAALAIFAAELQPPVAKQFEIKFFGNVNLSGKPLETGRLLLYTKDDQIFGCLIRNGAYNLLNPPTGQFTMTIDGKGVDEKYGDEASSGLHVALVQLANRVDFELREWKQVTFR